MMEEDVEEVRDALTGTLVSDEDEAKALRRVQKWAARDESHRTRTGYDGTDHLDKFLFLLKMRTVSVSGVRTAWVEQTTNVFDLYFDELEGARLSEFQRIVRTSRTQAAEGRTSERPESAWSFVAKREALGVMGMVKGLSTSAAGLVDLGAWALGADLSGGGLAGEVGKGWDEMGAAAAGAMDVDINEETVLGQSSFSVGDIGGKFIGALTTAGALSGAGVATQAGVAAVQTAKGIDDLGVALAKLRRGPPELPWSEIVRRPDIWAKVVGVVASATGMVGSANAANAAVKEACDTLGIVLGSGQVVVLVAAYRAVDQDPTISSPAERRQRKADLLAEIASTGALTIDSRYGQPFRKLWEANHATAQAPERSVVSGRGPEAVTPSVPAAPELNAATAAGTVSEPIAHAAETTYGPPAPETAPLVQSPGLKPSLVPKPRAPDAAPQVEGPTAAPTEQVPDKPLDESTADSLRVWVNTRSGVYHSKESPYFGATKRGMYMTREQAEAAHYRAAKPSNLGPARLGTAEHGRMTAELRQFEGVVLDNGWELRKVERSIGGRRRIDQLWVHQADKKVAVTDYFTGRVESASHYEKGMNYQFEAEVQELLKLGYKYEYHPVVMHGGKPKK